MDIMSVDSLEQHLLVIDVNHLPSELNLAEAMTGVGSLYSIAVPVLEFQNDRVEIGLLLGPENRRTYRKPYPDGPAACMASTDG